MNWHLETTEPLTAADFPDAVDELELPDGTPEAEEQLNAAKEAAKAMLASGAIGDPSDDEAHFGAELYGTANPAHEPVEGQPFDRFSVAVRQVTAAPALEEAEEEPVDGRSAEEVDIEERAKAEAEAKG